MRDIYIKPIIKDCRDISSRLVAEGNVNNPDITIFIPTYKRNATLELTLRSAVEQIEGGNYEIVVINDYPETTDADIFKTLKLFDTSRIYYYVNEQNLGLCGNWNRGIELARGNYVAMIHDDDLLSPYFLMSIRKAIKDNNYPGIIGVDYEKFDSKNIPEFNKPDKLTYRELTKKSHFFGNYINIAGMTVRKDLMVKIGGYADEYFPNQDTILIYQALIYDRVININNVLAGYRVEINISLSGDVMRNVILLTEKTRRNIAQYEHFAKRWMNMFDKEYLYAYICSANAYWNLNINYREIFDQIGMDSTDINSFKYKLMKLLLRIERVREKICQLLF